MSHTDRNIASETRSLLVGSRGSPRKNVLLLQVFIGYIFRLRGVPGTIPGFKLTYSL
jgi:hypothetical protein